MHMHSDVWKVLTSRQYACGHNNLYKMIVTTRHRQHRVARILGLLTRVTELYKTPLIVLGELVPPQRMLPLPISFYKDPRSAVLEYANVDFHHLLATSANQALHFPKLRQQENLQVKAQKLQAAREANLNKKLKKLTPVQDFEDCCNR